VDGRRLYPRTRCRGAQHEERHRLRRGPLRHEGRQRNVRPRDGRDGRVPLRDRGRVHARPEGRRVRRAPRVRRHRSFGHALLLRDLGCLAHARSSEPDSGLPLAPRPRGRHERERAHGRLHGNHACRALSEADRLHVRVERGRASSRLPADEPGQVPSGRAPGSFDDGARRLRRARCDDASPENDRDSSRRRRTACVQARVRHGVGRLRNPEQRHDRAKPPHRGSAVRAGCPDRLQRHRHQWERALDDDDCMVLDGGTGRRVHRWEHVRYERLGVGQRRAEHELVLERSVRQLRRRQLAHRALRRRRRRRPRRRLRPPRRGDPVRARPRREGVRLRRRVRSDGARERPDRAERRRPAPEGLVQRQQLEDHPVRRRDRRRARRRVHPDGLRVSVLGLHRCRLVVLRRFRQRRLGSGDLREQSHLRLP
jgi:hypothetical protein